jgi:ATP-dependent helicase Lhr and Lhr-like helicase
MTETPGYQAAMQWFTKQEWKPFPFQEEVWQAYLSGKDGLLNAPTGSGKTLALWMPVLIDWINKNPDTYKTKTKNGLKLLWITPLRALTKDIKKSLQTSAWDMDVPWLIKVRTGDTSASEKQQMKKQVPEVLITTPESLHVMLSQKNYVSTFKNLEAVVIDEWHELLGGKRGVQVELGLSRLRAISPGFKSWCISATIGNLNQALEVLVGEGNAGKNNVIIKAEIEKLLNIQTILPDEIERFPWSGHLGLNMASRLIPILEQSRSSLIFTNTRGQSEMWYKKLIDIYPDFAGNMAIHHGSLDRDVRDWVEDAIHEDRLKVVVCTSSLDLGVDFAPVETVIQVGSPKGVSRFLQRAGRSGHRPGVASNIYFLPTNSLELLEAAGLKEAIKRKLFEARPPMEKPFDVLVQYLVTLAVSDGFDGEALYHEIKSTYAFRNITSEEWEWALDFISTGGETLKEYNEYQKAEKIGNFFKVTSKRVALRHRLSIGTIVSDPMMRVQFLRGSNLGSIEESFISKLNPGDIFWFAGRALEFVKAKEMVAYVKKTNKTSGIIPSWLGGRMSLSTQLSQMVREKLNDYKNNKITDVEIQKLAPLLDLQKEWSAIPEENELLIEKVKTDEGYHIFMFPFAGRSIHEGLSALIAFRLAQRQPISFSIAMNDYGFELLADEEVDIEHAIKTGLFDIKYLREDILQSVNGTEMGRRRFREIAQISGLLFSGYPGNMKKNKHLQASSSLLFDVFREYDPDNLLVKQAYDEVFRYQLDEDHLRELLTITGRQKIKITYPEKPTPFAFPIMVDRLREKLTSEKLEDRIKKLQIELLES